MIEIKDLSFSYPVKRNISQIIRHPFSRKKHTVLKNINLQVSEGEIHSLLGLNGAGKTTLLRILSTLLLPTKGEALIDGFDVVNSTKHVKRCIGIATNNERTFYFRLTARQNLEFFGAMQNLGKKKLASRIDNVLKSVDLYKVQHTRYDSFSQGMRQRLAIARALLHDPKVIILDEPTTGVDIIGVEEIRSVIRKLATEKKKTFIIATHNLEEAAISDNISILHDGKIKKTIPKADTEKLRKEYMEIVIRRENK